MRRTKAPTPIPKKSVKYGPKEYCCRDCDVKFTIHWKGHTKPYCPKCTDNVAVRVISAIRKAVRSRSLPRWTTEQKETLMRLYKTTSLNYKEIGHQLSRTEKSVYHMIRRLRLASMVSRW